MLVQDWKTSHLVSPEGSLLGLHMATFSLSLYVHIPAVTHGLPVMLAVELGPVLTSSVGVDYLLPGF